MNESNSSNNASKKAISNQVSKQLVSTDLNDEVVWPTTNQQQAPLQNSSTSYLDTQYYTNSPRTQGNVTSESSARAESSTKASNDYSKNINNEPELDSEDTLTRAEAALLATTISASNKVNHANSKQDNIEAELRVDEGLNEFPDDEQDKIQRQVRKRIAVRSQSSPSSLTTQRFGLRPTPSPPRLVIDHRTGDIVEQQQYNHPHYQFSANNLRKHSTAENFDVDDEDSLTHPQPPPLSEQQQLEYYNQLIAQLTNSSSPQEQAQLIELLNIISPRKPPTQHQQHYNYCHNLSSENQTQAAMSYNRQGNKHLSKTTPIPPPHMAAKGFYGLPECCNNDQQLFANNVDLLLNSPQANFFNNSFAEPNKHDKYNRQIGASRSLTPSYQQQQQLQLDEDPNFASIRQTVDKLSNSQTTDIAFVQAPNDRPLLDASQRRKVRQDLAASARQQAAAQLIGNTATLNNTVTIKQSPLNALHCKQNMSQPNHHKYVLSQNRKQAVEEVVDDEEDDATEDAGFAPNYAPNINDFAIHKLAYNAVVLMVLATSCYILYFMYAYLLPICANYRQMHSYVSIITSIVNLAFVIAFTLFWFARARILYTNISSSAFIVSIYSILSVVNLTIAIVFFLVNTCQHQKLVTSTHFVAPVEVLLPIAAFDDSTTTTTTTTIQPSVFDNSFYDANNSDNLDIVDVAAATAATNTAANSRDGDSNSRDSQPLPSNFMRDAMPLHSLGQRSRSSNHDSNKARGNRIASILADYSSVHIPQNREQLAVKPQIQAMSMLFDDSSDETSKEDEPQTSAGQPTTAQTPSADSASGSPTPQSPGNSTNADDEQADADADAQVTMSPFEASWLYLQQEAMNLRQVFYRFLMAYDLKFIGALHALCAMCLQYCAMKVAVARSYFVRPMLLGRTTASII